MAPLRVLHVSMECVPFSKVGGMADVVGALPRALVPFDVDARVLTPYYPQLNHVQPGRELAAFDVQVGRGTHPVRLLEAAPFGVLVHQPTAFDRGGVYDDPLSGEGYGDSLFRCLVLQQAARVALRSGALAADVVHCHDSHTGLLPVYLRDDGGPPTVFTIHNLAYQGLYDGSQFALTGLDAARFTGHGPFEFYGDLSLLKAAITHSDLVTTVSPNYAREIVQPEFGHGLDGVLRSLGDRLVGILNGIDSEAWDPATDSHLPERFHAGDLAGKRACTRTLRATMGLDADEAAPLCGIVSRVTHQKGLDLVGALLPWLVRHGAQLAVLGAGDQGILDLFRGARGRWPGRVALWEGHNEGLSHLVYGGAEVFLVPSRFEPCGLTQMYAMRYGAVPVVTSMGGLKDTVTPFDAAHPDGTGVLAHWATTESFMGALAHALDLYRRPEDFARMQRNGMGRDFSWARSARAYRDAYDRVVRR